MLEDSKNHFSLVRFIQDFEELDALVSSRIYEKYKKGNLTNNKHLLP